MPHWAEHSGLCIGGPIDGEVRTTRESAFRIYEVGDYPFIGPGVTYMVERMVVVWKDRGGIKHRYECTPFIFADDFERQRRRCQQSLVAIANLALMFATKSRFAGEHEWVEGWQIGDMFPGNEVCRWCWRSSDAVRAYACSGPRGPQPSNQLTGVE